MPTRGFEILCHPGRHNNTLPRRALRASVTFTFQDEKFNIHIRSIV